MNQYRMNRISEEIRALKALDKHSRRITVKFDKVKPMPRLLFHYVDTPGLVQTGRRITVWASWDARVILSVNYPIQSPIVLLTPHRCGGRPFHPNVLPVPPYQVCYGHHLPNCLLDELALRIERMIVLHPQAVMTDEYDSMNRAACEFVRSLIIDHLAPLQLQTSLPRRYSQWVIS